jgi:hypothetical protein
MEAFEAEGVDSAMEAYARDKEEVNPGIFSESRHAEGHR